MVQTQTNANGVSRATVADLIGAMHERNLSGVQALCRALGKKLNEPIDFSGMGRMTVLDYARGRLGRAIKSEPMSQSLFYQQVVDALENEGALSIAAVRFKEHLEGKATNQPNLHFAPLI